MNIKSLLLRVVAVFGLSFICSMAVVGSANAATLGRNNFDGYFRNNYDTSGGFVLSNGLLQNCTSNCLSQFLQYMDDTVNGKNGGSDQTGAAFIIHAWYGKPATDYCSNSTTCGSGARNTGVNDAIAQLAQFKSDVSAYDAAGRISWNQTVDYQCGFLNSYHQGSFDDDAFYSDNNFHPSTGTSGKCSGTDIIDIEPTVVFFDAAGNVVFEIKKNCGNIVQYNAPPPPPSVTVSGQVTVTNSSGTFGVSGAVIDMCNGIIVSTDGSGNFSHTFNVGDSFCVRVSSGAPPNAAGPTTPGYAFDPPGVPGGTSNTSYEFQVAGVACYPSNCVAQQNQYDRSSDSGYDFNYLARDASCTAMAYPPAVTTQTTFYVTVNMTNTGGTTWAPPDYELGDYWSTAPNHDRGTWGVSRVALPPPGNFPPGSTASFGFYVTAPAVTTVTNIEFGWQMVQEGVTWFGQPCDTTITVNPQPYNYVPAVPTGSPPPGNIAAGTPFTLTTSVTNQGAGPGPSATLQFNVIGGNGYLLPTPPSSTTIAGLQPGASSAPFSQSFNTSATTPDGTVYCFTASVSPAQGVNGGAASLNTATSQQVCYTIQNRRYPWLQTLSGDVHAGDSNNSVNCNSSSITDQPSGGKWEPATSNDGSYAVATFGGISNFGSVSGYDLGSTGHYYCIPKPDAVGEVNYDIANGIYAGETANGNNCNTLGLPPGPKGSLQGVIYEVSSGNATCSGGLAQHTIKGKGTLFVTGDLYIKGNITYDATASQPPSFGVVATGNIYIDPAVTHLDGLYWAGRTIDTCSSPGNAYTGASCNQQLTANGLMIADSFRLARTYYGPEPGINPLPAEQLTYLAQAIADPPPGFLDFSSNVVLGRSTSTQLPRF